MDRLMTFTLLIYLQTSLVFICCNSMKSFSPQKAKMIRSAIIVDDELYEKMIEEKSFRGKNINSEIVKQIIKAFRDINELLKTLDDGGFRLVFNKNFVKLSQSNVRLGDTYLDRRVDDIRKAFDPDDIYSYSFTFQEAIEKIPDRHNVDITILFIPEKTKSSTIAASEETCICNPAWYACVAIFSIRDLENWSYHSTIFAHEIGHTLGMDIHDDSVYDKNPSGQLLMCPKLLLMQMFGQQKPEEE